MEILELKNGSVDVNNIDTYNKLQKKLNFIRKRLDCATSPLFKTDYFRLGDYGSSTACENKNYIILSNGRSDMDEKLKQDIIDFLTAKFIEQMNQVIKQMNELIK